MARYVVGFVDSVLKVDACYNGKQTSGGDDASDGFPPPSVALGVPFGVSHLVDASCDDPGHQKGGGNQHCMVYQ